MRACSAAMPEILAPAGNQQALEAAVRAGADAVYLGLTDFNARRTAGIKVGKAQIYGVRPGAHGGLQRLLVACGRQYLRHGGRTGPHQWFSFK